VIYFNYKKYLKLCYGGISALKKNKLKKTTIKFSRGGGGGKNLKINIKYFFFLKKKKKKKMKKKKK